MFFKVYNITRNPSPNWFKIQDPDPNYRYLFYEKKIVLFRNQVKKPIHRPPFEINWYLPYRHKTNFFTQNYCVADPDPHGSAFKKSPGSGSAWTDADPDPGGKKA